MIARFFRNAGLIGAVEVLIRLRGLITLPLLTRQLSTTEYGMWAQVMVIATLFGPLITLSTESAVLRYLPGQTRERQRTEFSAWVCMLLVCNLLIGGLLMVDPRLTARAVFGLNDVLARFVPYAVATMTVGNMVAAARVWLRVRNDVFVWTLTSVAQALLGVGAVVLTIVRDEGVIRLIIYSILGDGILVCALTAYIALRGGIGRPNFSVLPSYLRFSLPLLPAAYAMWGLNMMDRLFLVRYTSLAEIGVYSVAYSLGYMVIQIFANPIWTMYPGQASELFNRGQIRPFIALTNACMLTMLGLVVPAIFGTVVLGGPLLMRLATSAYIEGAPIIAIVTFAYLCHMLSAFFDTTLSLKHRQAWSTVSIAVAVAVNLILNFVLIPRYGIVGAAFATAIAFAIQLIMSLLAARQFFPVPLDWGRMLRILLAGLLMAGTVALISNIVHGSTLSGLALEIAAGVFIYLALIHLLRLQPIGGWRTLWKATELAAVADTGLEKL